MGQDVLDVVGDELSDLLGVSGEDLAVGADMDLDVSGDDDDDETGADDDDDVGALVGARRRRTGRKGGGMIRMSRKAFKRLLPHLKKAQFHARLDRIGALARAGHIPQIPLPIDSGTAVLAGQNATINTTPQVPVRITDFFVAPEIATQFNILSMTMARLNLLGSGGNLAASLFDPTTGAQRAPIEVRIVPAGSTIITIVNNKSLTDAVFQGHFQSIDLITHVYGGIT